MKKSKLKQKVIENASSVILLIQKDILTKQEVRKMLGLRKKKR